MKNLIIVFIAVLVCSCNKEDNTPPTSITITKIVLTDFQDYGLDVSPASGPDLFISFTPGSGCSFSPFTSDVHQDAAPGTQYEFIPAQPFTTTGVNSNYALCLFDMDSAGIVEQVGAGIEFYLYDQTVGKPAVRSIGPGGVKFDIYMEYN